MEGDQSRCAWILLAILLFIIVFAVIIKMRSDDYDSDEVDTMTYWNK